MASVEVGPESTVPGTRAWAQAVAANAKRYASFTEKDVRPLVERFRQLCDYQAWELWYPREVEARERFCRDVLGYDVEFLDTMSKGVEILEGRGHTGPITADQALGVHGGNRRGPEFQGSNITLIRGTAETYTRRRLRRDSPELADRVERGELSANAAAIEAGFRPKTITVPITRPETIARTLRKHMTPEDIAVLIDHLGARTA